MEIKRWLVGVNACWADYIGRWRKTVCCKLSPVATSCECSWNFDRFTPRRQPVTSSSRHSVFSRVNSRATWRLYTQQLLLHYNYEYWPSTVNNMKIMPDAAGIMRKWRLELDVVQMLHRAKAEGRVFLLVPAYTRVVPEQSINQTEFPK